MGKLPFIQFMIGDYIKSTRCLSLIEKGAWTEILWAMWENNQSGEITGTWEDISLIVGANGEEIAKSVFGKIAAKKVCELSFEIKDGQELVTIVNRRMNKEFKLKQVRSTSGSKGAEKTNNLKKDTANNAAKPQQASDNGNESENESENDTGFDIEFCDSKIKKKFLSFLKFRKEIKKPYKLQKSVEACYKNLLELSNNDFELAEKIIQRSIANQWQGLFAYPPNQHKSNGGAKDFTG